MSLQSLIANGNYESAQAAYDAITTPSVEVRDDQLYTWAGVADLVGPEAAENLRIKFDTNGLGWVSLQLGGLGLPLTDNRVRLAMAGFVQMGVVGCDVLLAKGISVVAPWQSAGIAEPTIQDVQEAWDVVQLTNAARARLLAIQATRLKWDQISQQVRSQIETGQIESAQVVSTVSQLWSE